MKRKILISLLVVSFFNYIGCYSYYTLTEEEKNAGRPYPDEKIKLILNDESEIDSYPPFGNISNSTFYLKVDTLERMLVGEGDITDGQTEKRSSFKGIIRGDLIDSSYTFVVDSEEYTVYWTKENKRLSFKKGEFIDFNPEKGAGYYIWESNGFQKKVAFNQIKEIQVDSYDELKTSLILGSLGIVFIIGVILLFKDFKGTSGF